MFNRNQPHLNTKLCCLPSVKCKAVNIVCKLLKHALLKLHLMHPLKRNHILNPSVREYHYNRVAIVV